MKRRDSVKTAGLAAMAVALPDADITASQSTPYFKKPATGHFKFKCGDLELMVITDGHILIKPPHPIFAPGIEANEVSTALNDALMSGDEIDAAINILVISKADRIIVIDAGAGNALGNNAGSFIKNLAGAGIQPEQVTDLLITHLHIDHIGGLLDADGRPVFTNALFFLAKEEHDFWMSPNPDFSGSKNTGDTAGAISIARTLVSATKSKLQLFNLGETLFDCIITESAIGHTPGHPVLNIFSNGAEIRHIVDIVHTPLLISQPHWGTQWDTDFEKGVATRFRILEELSNSKTLAISSHLPWPGIGYITGDLSLGYRWTPKAFSTPQLYDSNT